MRLKTGNIAPEAAFKAVKIPMKHMFDYELKNLHKFLKDGTAA